MIRRLKLAGLIIIFIIIRWSSTIAQTLDCQQVLIQANDEFNAGRFYGIPGLLSDCLERFTNEQKVQAYHLLAQTYLIIDDPMAADDSYLRLLEADPEYVADPSKDPIDIVYLSSKFTATPIFTPHLRAGGNVSMVRTIYEVNTEGYAVARKFSLKPGFQVGVGMDWNLNDNISLGGELQYSFRDYQITRTGIAVDDDLIITERQSWVDVPLYAKYKDHLGKIRPFGYVGFSFNFLINASVELETVNRGSTSESGILPTVGQTENVTYKRNFINRSVVLGGGIYYKIGKNFLFADARYSIGLTNLANEKIFYSKEGDLLANTIGRYKWIGDLYRQDFISVSVGYVRPIYNPRKLKKARSKNVLKNVDDN
jgi:hypothetical protein